MAIGALEEHTEQYDKARETLKLAIQDLADTNSPELMIPYFLILGNTYRAQKDWKLAVNSYRAASSFLSIVRNRTQAKSLQTGFFAQHTDLFPLLAQCLLETDSVTRQR